jgi:hypothetical protein
LIASGVGAAGLHGVSQLDWQHVGSQHRRPRHRRSSKLHLLGAHGSLHFVSQQLVWQQVNRDQHLLKQLLRQQRDSQQLDLQHEVVQHFDSQQALLGQQLVVGQHGGASETRHGTIRHFLTHTV